MTSKKLSDHQVDIVCQLCNDENFSQSKVANLFEVSQGTISNVLRERKQETAENSKHSHNHAPSKRYSLK